ncbi:MAG: hypothetical protein EAZ57_06255 [Cytophagales bacterium]|nr:MAG: hypothetical protein EAZ67_08445 [Cytophagales bacterium]TAF60783.1 MAG: hypothetical protein EAZ57_06255 [Cytophagales bacterium]
MKFLKSLTSAVLAVLLILALKGCGSATVQNTDQAANNVADVSQNAAQSVTVKAYLVYESGKLSSFDIINSKDIQLWNTIIGEGSAEEASSQTKVILEGQGSVDVLIKNGDKIAIDQKGVVLQGNTEYEIKDTGCGILSIQILANGKELYNQSVSFNCGE